MPRIAILLAALVLSLGSRAEAWERAVVSIRTDDGVTLRALRLETKGTPVLLCHGFGANTNQFLISGRSLAGFLARRGYDVWCLNFRGVGRGKLRSGGNPDHSFDDLVALDLPAAVRAVRKTTRRRPFLIGHSQGGMVALAWLQGVERVRVPVRRRGERIVRQPRMRASARLRRERTRAVRGVVAIGSPARFTWPGHRRVRPRSAWDRNLALAYLSRSPTANLATRLLPAIEPQRASAFLGRVLARLPKRLARRSLRRLSRSRSSLLRIWLRPGSTDPRVLSAALQRAVGPHSAKVGRQFLDGIRTGDMRELHVRDALRRPYSYAAGMRRVQAPVLWIAGSRDKLANDEAIAAAVKVLPSRDKTYLPTGHGHIDLVLGDEAPRTVWAPIARWLDRR